MLTPHGLRCKETGAPVLASTQFANGPTNSSSAPVADGPTGLPRLFYSKVTGLLPPPDRLQLRNRMCAAEPGAFAGLDFDAAIARVGTQEPMVRRLFPGGNGPPTNDQAKKSGAVTPRDTLYAVPPGQG